MIGYVTLGTNDIAKARDFYDALFATIGVGRLMEFGENFTMWGKAWGPSGERNPGAPSSVPPSSSALA